MLNSEMFESRSGYFRAHVGLLGICQAPPSTPGYVKLSLVFHRVQLRGFGRWLRL